MIDGAARPVEPTATGERLLGYARRILALQEEAQAVLGDPAGTTSIRIGVPEDIVTSAMAAVFSDFARRHRTIRLDVTAGLSRDLTRRYRAGEFDIVIVKEPSGRSIPPGDLVRKPWPGSRAPMDLGEGSTRCRWLAFPPGGLYREAMFQRIEQEQRRWYIASSGSSLGIACWWRSRRNRPLSCRQERRCGYRAAMHVSARNLRWPSRSTHGKARDRARN